MSNLSILIVEDNYEKVRVIADAIKDNDTCELEYCNNTRESLSKLQGKKYNILLVDMVLPKCIGDHSEPDAGVELIERLYVDQRLYSPDEIVAVTSHADAYDKHKDRLSDLGVPFVLADDSFEKIKSVLLNKINYCSNLKLSSTATSAQLDGDSLSLPEKVTLKWVYQNVGLSFWIKVISIVLAIFILGIQSSKLTVVQQIFSIEKKEDTFKQKEDKTIQEKSVSSLTEKGAIKVKFIDGFAFVNFSYDTSINPNDAPKIVSVFGNKEKAQKLLGQSIVSEVHTQMEQLSILEARTNRRLIENDIVEATINRQVETFIRISNLEIMAIDQSS